MPENPIQSTISFGTDGVSHGFLKLPWSRDDSAWGSLMIPITVIRNGSGPTAVLTGGNHGDEYEGPVALFDLANTLQYTEISGRVILIPAMNYPAFQVARRTSPIDQGNMNRSFPGNPCGTITEKIADYFQQVLLPMADIVLDIHSGGKTLDFVPFCASHVLQDKSQEQRCVEVRDAFNAPYSLQLLELDMVGMYDSAAEEMGKTFISTELGGGGSASAASIQIAKRGIRNVLKYSGILSGSFQLDTSKELEMPDEQCFITSESKGLLEMRVNLGEFVKTGDHVASVHETSRTGVRPLEYRAQLDGILIGRHFPGLITMGDVVAVVGVEK